MINLWIYFLAGMGLLSNLLIPVAHSAENVSVKTVFQYKVGGEGGWDLLTFDPKHRYLYISRTSHVQVIEADSGKAVGDILETAGVHGIALAEDLNLGFTSNGKSNSVTVFDMSTLRVVDTLKISGLNPDVIMYEPVSKHVFVFNGRSANAVIIDAISLKEIGTILLPGKPELAVSNATGNVFVNIEDKNQVVVIDSQSNKIVKTFSLGSGLEPTGLAIDQAHNRLFSTCANNKMVILDAQTGKVLAEVAIGSGPDSAAFDAKLGLALSSNGEGTLTIVNEKDPEHFSVLENVQTQRGARTMAYDAEQHKAYLVTASFGETPPVTKDQPKPRPAIVPNSFVVLVVSFIQQ